MTRTISLDLLVVAILAATSCLGADITTRDGTTYRDAKVTGVDPDGLRVTHSIGVAKLRFEDLPEALQKQYYFDASKVAAYRKEVEDAQKTAAERAAAAQPSNSQATAAPQTTAAHRPDELVADAESALRKNDFPRAAELLNAITSQYPSSTQARTVRELAYFLRDKQITREGPFTASEAQRLRQVMDALQKIKVGYQTASPEKRRALETILGKETFESMDTGLEALSTSGAKLRDSTDRAR